MAYGKGTSTQTVISRNPLARHRGEYDSKHLRVSQLHLHPRTVEGVRAAVDRFHRHFADRTDLTGAPPSCTQLHCSMHVQHTTPSRDVPPTPTPTPFLLLLYCTLLKTFRGCKWH